MKKKFLLFLLVAAFSASAQQLPVNTDHRNIYDDALELYDKNLFSSAYLRFNDFLNQYAPHQISLENGLYANARYYQATSAYFSGAVNTIELLDGFIAAFPQHSQIPFAQYCGGMYYFDKLNFKKALPYLNVCSKSALIQGKNQALFSDLDREKFIFALGYCFMMDGDDINADNYFVKIKDKPGPYQETSLYFHSLISYKNELYREAYNGFSRLESSSVYGEKMPLLMANCLLMEKDYNGLQQLADRMSKEEPQVTFLAANAAYEKRDYAKAAEMYDKYLAKITTPDRLTLFRTGYSHYKLDAYEKAIAPLTKVSLQAKSDSLSQAASYYLGFCFQKENQLDNALVAYKEAAKAKGTQNEAMAKDAAYQHAKLCFATRNYNDAMTALSGLNEKYPDAEFSEEVSEMIAEIFSYSQNYEDAITYFEKTNMKSSRAKSAYHSACFWYGLEFLKRQQWDKAESYLTKAANNNQVADLRLSALYWLAEMKYKQNNYPESMGRYIDYMNASGAKAHPMYPYAQYGLAWGYFEQKKYKDAGINFEEFLKSATKGGVPENYTSEAYARLGDIEFLAKNYPKAIKHYQKVIEKGGINEDYALLQTGEAYYRTQKIELSLQSFGKIVTAYPQSAFRDEALDRMSEIYNASKRELEQSEKYAQMLVKAYPRNPLAADAYNRLGVIAYEKELIPKAMTYFQKVIDDYTYDTRNCNIALSNISSIVSPSEFDNVLKEYKLKNPNADGQLSELTFNTGKERYYLGSYGAAIELLTNYLSINETGKYAFEALFLRGESFKNTEQYSLALADFEKIYNQPVQNNFTLNAYSSAIDIKYNLGDYDGSLKLCKLMEKDAQTQEAKTAVGFGLARNYMAKKEFSNAIQALEPLLANKLVEQEVIMQAKLWKGNCLYGLKKYDESITLYQEVVSHEANEIGAEAQYMLVRTYFAKGLYPECIEAGKLSKNNYMDSEWKDRAILWMAEANIELQNLLQAKDLLEDVVKSTPYPDVQKYAEDRLKDMEQIK